MPRHIPQERKFCIAALKKLSKRKDVGGPTILGAIDRIAHLDGLYKVELVRPKERPDKWADTRPISLPESGQTPEEVDAITERVLLARFNLEHYGGANGANTSTTASAPGAAVQSPDPAGKPE